MAGRFIVDQVFQKARKWQTDFPDLMAGFNVSYLQFRDSGFVDYLIQKANEYELNPGYLCIELTKSSRAVAGQEFWQKKDKINDKNFAIYLVLNLFYFGFIVSFQ